MIASVDFGYVGISLDGMGATHDKFRRMEGAFDKSLHAIRLCRDAGLKVGVRFTLTQDNFHDLPALLQLVEDEGVDRFYFSHLNYAGRGNKNRKDDAQHQMTRQAMDLLFDTCWRTSSRGCRRNSPPATTTPTASTCCTGSSAISRPGRAHPHRSWRSGAAIPAA